MDDAVDLSNLKQGANADAAPVNERDAEVYQIPPGVIEFHKGPEFVVDEPDSIRWHAKGVFATGKFKGSDTEEDRLFFDNTVKSIKFDFSKVMGE